MGPVQWVSVASWTTIVTPPLPARKQLTRINRSHFTVALQTPGLTLDTSPSLRKAYDVWLPDTEITQIYVAIFLAIIASQVTHFLHLAGAQKSRGWDWVRWTSLDYPPPSCAWYHTFLCWSHSILPSNILYLPHLQTQGGSIIAEKLQIVMAASWLIYKSLREIS